jgi:hypothetical protein
MEIVKGNGKIGVIIQVMDIFDKIKNFEEMPDEKSEEYKTYEKEELKAHKKVIKEVINEYKQKGYKCVGFYNQEIDKKMNKELVLGINGVYLIVFKKV